MKSNEGGTHASDLTEPERTRIIELVEIQPTKNGELQEQWGLNNRTRLHLYLKSYLTDYHYLDDDGCVRTTPAGERVARKQQDSTRGRTETPEVGEVFTAAIDRVSAAGNGIIERDGGHINIGPVLDDSDGEVIEAEMLDDVFARCRTERVTPEGYEERFQHVHRGDEPLARPDGTPPEQSNCDQTDADVIVDTCFCDNCGSVMVPRRNQWTCGSCGRKEPKDGQEVEFELTRTEEEQRARNRKRIAETSNDSTETDDPEPSATSSSAEPSRQEMVEELRRINDSLDRIPYSSDMDEDGAYTAYAYHERFGSWDDALDAAGINKEDVLLRDMQKVAEEVGEVPTKPEMNEHGKYSGSMAARYFGSWSEAKERFNEWKSSTKQGEDAEGSTKGTSSETENDVPGREALLEELERINDSLDRIPYPRDMNDDGAYTTHAYQKEFESWDDALAVAGIDKEAALLDELQRVTDKLGKKPSQTEMSEHGIYGFGMYRNFFGSWSTAKERLDNWEADNTSESRTDETSLREEVSEVVDTDDEEDNGDPFGSTIDKRLEELMQAGGSGV